MLVQFTDFNGAGNLIASKFSTEWNQLDTVIAGMPLHLKASDQARLQGNPIFDAVGTNEYLKATLQQRNWLAKIAIPPAFHFLGTDVDFGKSGVIVEVQFSNYPFLLNNILRSELFFKAKTLFSGHPTEVIVIITKDGIFPASNSTLYYQQAVSQLSALANYNVFAVPTRLVCLSSPVNAVVPSTWTTYSNPRYSRSVATRINRPCQVSTRTRRTSTAKRVIKPALKPAVAVAARGALQRVVLTFPLNPVP